MVWPHSANHRPRTTFALWFEVTDVSIAGRVYRHSPLSVSSQMHCSVVNRRISCDIAFVHCIAAADSRTSRRAEQGSLAEHLGRSGGIGVARATALIDPRIWSVEVTRGAVVPIAGTARSPHIWSEVHQAGR